MYVELEREKKSNERVNGLDSALSVFLPNSRFSFLLDNFFFFLFHLHYDANYQLYCMFIQLNINCDEITYEKISHTDLQSIHAKKKTEIFFNLHR